MRKVYIVIVVLLMGIVTEVSAQYNISKLHSASGKKWVQLVNPDDNQARPEDVDDSFTFFSNGTVTIDLGNLQAAYHAPSSTKPPKDANTWRMNGPIIMWAVVVNNQVMNYQAEIQYLDDKKLVVTLLEPGKEVGRNVVFVVN